MPAMCACAKTKAGRTCIGRPHAARSTASTTASSRPTAPSTRRPSPTTADGNVMRRMPNLVKFLGDPDAMLVMSLEDYDEMTGKAAEGRHHAQRRRGPQPAHHVRAQRRGRAAGLPQDGSGEVDLPYIASLYSGSPRQVIDELGDLIYQDPESGAWQTADAYLSGNVREKLALAEKAGAAYARNVEALRAVQPEDVLPGDIDANLGAPWIPAADIEAFAAELFGIAVILHPVGHFAEKTPSGASTPTSA